MNLMWDWFWSGDGIWGPEREQFFCYYEPLVDVVKTLFFSHRKVISILLEEMERVRILRAHNGWSKNRGEHPCFRVKR